MVINNTAVNNVTTNNTTQWIKKKHPQQTMQLPLTSHNMAIGICDIIIVCKLHKTQDYTP